MLYKFKLLPDNNAFWYPGLSLSRIAYLRENSPSLRIFTHQIGFLVLGSSESNSVFEISKVALIRLSTHLSVYGFLPLGVRRPSNAFSSLNDIEIASRSK
jgi:hypothetical protein